MCCFGVIQSTNCGLWNSPDLCSNLIPSRQITEHSELVFNCIIGDNLLDKRVGRSKWNNIREAPAVELSTEQWFKKRYFPLCNFVMRPSKWGVKQRYCISCWNFVTVQNPSKRKTTSIFEIPITYFEDLQFFFLENLYVFAGRSAGNNMASCPG